MYIETGFHYHRSYMSIEIIPRSKVETLKKHVALIHVSGQPSLLQRRAANTLHLHAYEELGDAGSEWHMIPIRELAEKIGFDSHNRQKLHEALLGLADIRVSFDLTGEGGGRIQGRMGYMSQVIIEHNSGLCRYSYPPIMRAWLHRPDLYARINLAVQRAFSSRYTLALYENCVRYKDNNKGYLARQHRRAYDQDTPAITGWKPLKWWREVLGVKEGRYSQFKELNRCILKPAMQEVNTFSDIVLDVQVGRKNRRISELLFVIRRSRQLSLFAPEDFLPPSEERDREPPPIAPPTALPPAPVRKAVAPRPKTPRTQPVAAQKYTAAEKVLCTRMRAYGVASHKHDELLALEKDDPGRIARNLRHMDRILQSEPESITKPGAWAVGAIRGDYASTMQPEILRGIEAKEERAKAAARRARQKAEADKRRAEEQHTMELEEDRRIKAACLALFERWSEEEQIQFDSEVVADLESQIDEETGAPALSTTSWVRDRQIRWEREARLREIVRESESG